MNCISILLPVFLFLPIPQESERIVPCVITEVNSSKVTTVCDDGKRNERVILDWDQQTEWHWQVEYPEPLRIDSVPQIRSDATPRAGQLIRAQPVGNLLLAVPPCEVRIQQNVERYANEKPGERIPIGAWTPPRDCRALSEFIVSLMKKHKRM